MHGGPSVHVHANDLQINYPGTHPLRENLAAICNAGRCQVSSVNAIDLYMRARLDGLHYDLVDCDAFGTGQPHTGDAWWAVKRGGLLYLCATDSLTTAGLNPGKAAVGFAAVAARKMPSCNEQGVRLLIGAAYREAAARGLHAEPKFGFFHRPSSTIRVMMQLRAAKPPTPTEVENRLQYVARCDTCGEVWRVPAARLGGAGSMRRCAHSADTFSVAGPMWAAPMHDAAFLSAMRLEAREREWEDTDALLGVMQSEAAAEAEGAILFYHLGELQRALSARQLVQPPLSAVIQLLQDASYEASRSHIELKAVKTSASIAEIVDCIEHACPTIALPDENV